MPDLRHLANEQCWNLVYWARRRGYRAALPPIAGRDAALTRRLKREGAVVSSLAELAIPQTARMLAAADALQRDIADRKPSKGGFGVQAMAAEVDRYPELIGWGLDERLLAIAENYIGLKVAYRGLTVRRDLAGGEKIETRLLHRDNEDNRILKIIVYLNDVDARGGP
ncbi:MAG: 2OG-Fe(II) oxygenase, partial [Alphaproteobacteria bacterium]|nr:2OG-Fe(II) oxygenase [Alphaproteobacteria bacterium]